VHSQGLDFEGYSLLVLLPELPLEVVPEVVVPLEVVVPWEDRLLPEELWADELLADARLEALWALGAGL
jgi:hypothetical protein